MEDSINFVPLLLVLFLAFAVPLLLGRLRWLPTIVGEIFAGVLIGVSGFNLVGHNLTLEVFSNIGLAFLMFLAGMEINFNQLFSREGDTSAPNLLLLSLLAYLGTLLLAFPGSLLINHLGLQANPWLLALIFSATSLGVLLPLLKKRELFGTIPGQLMFYTALLADFVTVILLTIFLITRNNGLSLQLFSILLLFLAFFLVYRLGWRFFRIRAISALVDELSHVTVQIKVRGAIAILMAFVVLAGVLGVELILGAFLAGMIISLLRSPEDTDLVHKLEAFGYGFFIPVFFILVGANLDLPALFRQPASLLFVPAMLLVSLLVKLLPALLFRRVLGWRETLSAGLLLNTHLSLEIAVAVIGLRLGLLSPSANVAIILFAVLTVLFMPVLFNTSMPSTPPKVEQVMLIYGAEDLGLQVARVLLQHGEQVRILEPETSLVEKARRAGFRAIQADSLRDCLEQIGQEEIQSLLVLTSNDTRNLLACRAAITHGIQHIVALVNDPLRLPDYRHLDVTTYTPTIYRPALLALMARNPDLLTLLTSTTDEQDVREVTLENPLLSGGLLRTLGLPGNLLVLSVSRDGEIIVPHGNTRLESGDRLTIVGDMEDLQDAAAWLGNKW